MSDADREQAPAADPGASYSAPPKVTDARALRALAHPTRVALLEAVAVSGPLTATGAARIVGGSVPNVSYHLRTLAKHGYVVEAEGGSGRERPWKLGNTGIRFDVGAADPTVSHAARALGEVLLDRWLGRMRHYESHREQYPADVRAVSDSSQFVVFGTAAEVQEAQAAIADILMRFADRLTDPALRPEGSTPFEMLVFTHPFETLAPADPEA
ncbi:helix-turn-helix domain-containing protein [Streptomyces sp. NPDC005813]|uniref:winged helix-turn-helix domain-containing protein n=1 Tax=Streptomyces sp. NPDC005813 TaxID=3155592 RepID=UPI0034066826